MSIARLKPLDTRIKEASVGVLLGPPRNILQEIPEAEVNYQTSLIVFNPSENYSVLMRKITGDNEPNGIAKERQRIRREVAELNSAVQEARKLGLAKSETWTWANREEIAQKYLRLTKSPAYFLFTELLQRDCMGRVDELYPLDHGRDRHEKVESFIKGWHETFQLGKKH